MGAGSGCPSRPLSIRNPEVMCSPDFSLAEARLELALLQAEANVTRSAEVYLWLRESGLPDEVSCCMFSLSEAGLRIEGRLVTLGKILTLQLAGFARAHPGFATADACRQVCACLMQRIPALAPMLQPLSAALGVANESAHPDARAAAERHFAVLIEMLNQLCLTDTATA